MPNRPFDRPVRFIHGTRLARLVANTDAALYFLEHKWPFVEGQAHQNAVRICKQVLGGKGTPQEARDAFVRALEEANFDLVE
jgi:hypothetical protein